MEDKSEYMKAYRLANKDKYKEYRKKWRQTHKDDEETKKKNAEYSKKYYNNKKNKDINSLSSISVVSQ